MGSSAYLNSLAIDTSGAYCSVAIRAGSKDVVHRESDGAGDHFERLPDLVREVLREARIAPEELSEVRIGLGPGSFTGLRIGTSFAKGLAAARHIPLVGVSSFAGMAHAAADLYHLPPGTHVIVISDARREELFLATYRVEEGGIAEVSAPRICGIGEISIIRGEKVDSIVVTPLLNFSLPGLQDLRSISRIAEGLLCVMDTSPGQTGIQGIAELEPHYLRAVAAKSIAERTRS